MPTDMTSRFRILNFAFVLGCAMNILLWFLPDMKVWTTDFVGTRFEEEAISQFHCVQMVSREAQAWVPIMYTLIFSRNIVFLALAIFRPRRWVYLTGAS